MKKADGVSTKSNKATAAKQGDAVVPSKKVKATAAKSVAEVSAKTKAAAKTKKDNKTTPKKAPKADAGTPKKTTKVAAAPKVCLGDLTSSSSSTSYQTGGSIWYF